MNGSPVLAAARYGMVAILRAHQTSCVNAQPAEGKPSPRHIGRTIGPSLDTIDKREVTLSYSYTQRRKTVRRFKEKFGEKNWYARFREHISAIVAERLGPPIGTVEEIMNAMGGPRGKPLHLPGSMATEMFELKER